MEYLVFDIENAKKATFTNNEGIRRNPQPIKNNLFFLLPELEEEIITHDNSIVYEKREILPGEFINEDSDN